MTTAVDDDEIAVWIAGLREAIDREGGIVSDCGCTGFEHYAAAMAGEPPLCAGRGGGVLVAGERCECCAAPAVRRVLGIVLACASCGRGECDRCVL